MFKLYDVNVFDLARRYWNGAVDVDHDRHRGDYETMVGDAASVLDNDVRTNKEESVAKTLMRLLPHVGELTCMKSNVSKRAARSASVVEGNGPGQLQSPPDNQTIGNGDSSGE